MMRDFARFEELEEYFEATEDHLHDVLFGPAAYVEALVAEENGTCAGYALYYPNYASFRGQKGLYLEDLYVAAEFRGLGVGERSSGRSPAMVRSGDSSGSTFRCWSGTPRRSGSTRNSELTVMRPSGISSSRMRLSLGSPSKSYAFKRECGWLSGVVPSHRIVATVFTPKGVTLTFLS